MGLAPIRFRPCRSHRDHTIVQHMIDMGDITPEQAKNHPESNILERCLGVTREITVDLAGPINILDDDRFLLCSDGLHGVVDDSLIWEIAHKGAPQDAVRKLIKVVSKYGAPDNVSVQILWKSAFSFEFYIQKVYNLAKKRLLYNENALAKKLASASFLGFFFGLLYQLFHQGAHRRNIALFVVGLLPILYGFLSTWKEPPFPKRKKQRLTPIPIDLFNEWFLKQLAKAMLPGALQTLLSSAIFLIMVRLNGNEFTHLAFSLLTLVSTTAIGFALTAVFSRSEYKIACIAMLFALQLLFNGRLTVNVLAIAAVGLISFVIAWLLTIKTLKKNWNIQHRRA